MANAAHSLRSRYASKFVANGIGGGLQLLTQIILPRALGPTAYGNFAFLSNFFSQAMGFLEMGTSFGFSTKVAQRPKDSGLRKFYLRFSVGIGLLEVAGVILILATPAREWFWPEQLDRYILMAAAYGALLWLSQTLTRMNDALGLTVVAEALRVAQRAVAFLVMVVFFLKGQLGLTAFFLIQIATTFALILGLFLMPRWSNLKMEDSEPTSKTASEYVSEFIAYSHPILALALFGTFANLLDRWLLQVISGSPEQGFFGLSTQVASICLLFTAAMSPLLLREFSIAAKEKNFEKLQKLFREHVPTFYAVAASLSCFVAANADWVSRGFGGANFAMAGASLGVLALSPALQTYGQLSGSLFYATGQTRLYRNIGIFQSLLGIPVSLYFLLPDHSGGLAMGAAGLAIKTIGIQFIGINLQLFYNARTLGLRFSRYLIHQVGCLVLFFALAKFARFCALNAVPNGSWTFQLLGTTLVYGAFMLAVVWRFPLAFGHLRASGKPGEKR